VECGAMIQVTPIKKKLPREPIENLSGVLSKCPLQ